MAYPFSSRLLLAGLLGLGGTACTSCIARGARVSTPNGLRPIESIAIGDAIHGVDVEARSLVATTVTAIRTATRETMRFTFGDGALRLTTDHPVFCPDEGVYAPAGDWVLGKRAALLRRTDAGLAWVLVEADLAGAEVHDVFDLTVASPHHSFLAEGVVVHNKSPLDAGVLCTDSTGLTHAEGDSCTCEGALGRYVCEGAVAVCSACGGTVDGGP
ncbi:MAG: Hint domain-containing protein [Sandaracinaceae bacterium]